MKLAYSPASPYVRKAMACAIARRGPGRQNRALDGRDHRPGPAAGQPPLQGAVSRHRRRDGALRQPGPMLQVPRQHRRRAGAAARPRPGALDGAAADGAGRRRRGCRASRAGARWRCRRGPASRVSVRLQRGKIARAPSTCWRPGPGRSACSPPSARSPSAAGSATSTSASRTSPGGPATRSWRPLVRQGRGPAAAGGDDAARRADRHRRAWRGGGDLG